MSAPGSACFVADDPDEFVTYVWTVARLLAREGWEVRVLYCAEGAGDPSAAAALRRRLADAGLGFSALGDFEVPYPNLPVYSTNRCLDRSEHIRHALQRLHAEHRFDLIEFSDRGGGGFRSIQARRTGVAFDDVRMIVKLHGFSQWRREANCQLPASVEDLRDDFAERYAFEHADVQLASRGSLLEAARAAGWRVRDDAAVLGDPRPERQPTPAGYEGEPVTEVVFFGALEAGKGLDVFVEACGTLDPAVRLTFLGRDAPRGNGQRASEWVRASLPGRQATLHTGLGHDEAVRYLRGKGRLAVMPSPVDECPYTVMECVARGIPFLAADVAGIADLLPDPLARQQLLFAPTAADLRRCLHAYLGATPAQRRAWHAAVSRGDDGATHNRAVAERYRRLLPPEVTPADRRHPGPASQPLVSVIVTYYNLGDYLPEALASLAGQTYPNLEVLVIDDGSTCPRSRRVLEEQQRLYPHYRFLRQANAGCGAARNYGLAEARGEYVVMFDADNVARPHMVATFVRGLQRSPDLSALTCYILGFTDSQDPAEKVLNCVSRVAGGPHVLGVCENVFGDTNAILRAADLRAVGGYETDRSVMAWQDWMTYVKLYNAGYRMDVVPECLFYYRMRGDSMSSATSNARKRYAMTQFLLRKGFLAAPPLPTVERASLWAAFMSFKDMAGGMWREQDLRRENDRSRQENNDLRHDNNLLRQENEALKARQKAVRYRVVDKLNGSLKTVPLLHRGLKAMLRMGVRTWRNLRRLVRGRGGSSSLPAG